MATCRSHWNSYKKRDLKFYYKNKKMCKKIVKNEVKKYGRSAAKLSLTSWQTGTKKESRSSP